MLKIAYRAQFKKELKQQEKRRKDIKKFLDIVEKLLNEKPLDPKHRNHRHWKF